MCNLTKHASYDSVGPKLLKRRPRTYTEAIRGKLKFHTKIHRTGVKTFSRTVTVQFGRLLYKQPQNVYVYIKKVKIVSPEPKMGRKKGLLFNEKNRENGFKNSPQYTTMHRYSRY